jgi:hypothetical protein
MCGFDVCVGIQAFPKRYLQPLVILEIAARMSRVLQIHALEVS